MLLLDTQVLVWLSHDERRLGRQARQVIDEAWRENQAAVSTMTFWEIGMLAEKGRVTLMQDLPTLRGSLLRDGLIEIQVDGEIAVRASLLPNLHGDPGDRIIVATALNGHTLITSDRKLLAWPGQVERLDARR